jgi:ribonuclease-3
MNPLEERMGYKFRNSLLLGEALTHPSLAYETRRPHFDNQRLEFLGDAVLQLLLTEHLYRLFPGFPEGRLTKLRSRLVSRDALKGYAERLGLGEFLLLGRGEEASGGRQRASSLADAFEALVGAIYLDSGLADAAVFALRSCEPELAAIAREPGEVNPKGELQEILQGPDTPGPCYSIVEETGPDHAKNFLSVVHWQGREIGRGSGSSKKQAEIQAAGDALAHRLWEKPPQA